MPDWLYKYEASLSAAEFPTDEAMMVVAVEISAQNVSRGTGGPFGCAIFQRDVNTKVCKLFSVGANRVVPLTNSTVHGEMAAIQFAEMKLKAFSLRKAEGDVYEYILCTSCEPCAMCLGGTFWAAPAEMICAATKDDAEAIGFDEGPVYPKSYVDLEKAGVKVKKAVLRAEGNKVLQDYAKLGVIYQG
jgi:tRNA(Arg) A34 adenosine deaminase TadA